MVREARGGESFREASVSSRELGRQTTDEKVKLSEKLQRIQESWVPDFHISQLLYGLVTAMRTWLPFSAHRQVWRRKENFTF